VWNAEAAFIEEVARRHPQALGKPAVIANCQAGWQTAIMAATRPELAGPLLLAGSPLSYWAGVRGKNPMRYLGGLLGGTWATALAATSGAGKFDGADLVAELREAQPGQHAVGQALQRLRQRRHRGRTVPRLRDLVGQPGAAQRPRDAVDRRQPVRRQQARRGKLRTRDGLQIDLRNIQSPIVVFASWGTTSPRRSRRSAGSPTSTATRPTSSCRGRRSSTRCTTPPATSASSSRARSPPRSTRSSSSAMDMLDMLPPGLYEATFEEIDKDPPTPTWSRAPTCFRLEPRTLDDIRALGENSLEDEMRFAAAQRISNINLQLYEPYVAPFVRAAVTPEMAAAMRELHPNRMRFAMFSDENPFMRFVAGMAEQARAEHAGRARTTRWRRSSRRWPRGSAPR
jgi:hypothetical protein